MNYNFVFKYLFSYSDESEKPKLKVSAKILNVHHPFFTPLSKRLMIKEADF